MKQSSWVTITHSKRKKLLESIFSNTKLPKGCPVLAHCFDSSFLFFLKIRSLRKSLTKEISTKFILIKTSTRSFFLRNFCYYILNSTILTLAYFTYACASGGKKCCFSENFTCFVFLKHPFWDSPFCLITDETLTLGVVQVP